MTFSWWYRPFSSSTAKHAWRQGFFRTERKIPRPPASPRRFSVANHSASCTGEGTLQDGDHMANDRKSGSSLSATSADGDDEPVMVAEARMAQLLLFRCRRCRLQCFSRPTSDDVRTGRPADAGGPHDEKDRHHEPPRSDIDSHLPGLWGLSCHRAGGRKSTSLH